MTAFRVFPPFTVFIDSQGAPLAGGSVEFYDTGTTTPRVVYGDKALTINNGSTLALDSAGRLAVGDCWASGSYRVRLYSSDAVLIDEYEDVEIPGGAGTTLPTLAIDELITSDGSVLVATTRREVPDPTGQADKVLSSDGTVLTWVAKPVDGAAGAAGVSDVTSSATGFTVGTNSVQLGDATCAASGTFKASDTVTFPVAFASAPRVFVLPTTNSHSAPVVPELTSAPSATGFTVSFDIAEGSGGSSSVTNPIPYAWIAIGIKV